MNPFDSRSAIAKASPNARAAVVEVVGARPKGHASSLVSKTIEISADLEIVELLFPVKDDILY